MSTQVKAKPVSIQNFAAALRKLPGLAFDRTDQVIDLLRLSPVVSDTLVPYLHWDRQHYTRNLIDKTPLYELIAICCEVGQTSSVHNHQDQNCWMAVPMGRLLVQNYRTISQDLRSGQCELMATNRVEMNPGNPCRVDPQEPVHSVLNPRELRRRKVPAARSSCTTRPNTGACEQSLANQLMATLKARDRIDG